MALSEAVGGLSEAGSTPISLNDGEMVAYGGSGMDRGGGASTSGVGLSGDRRTLLHLAPLPLAGVSALALLDEGFRQQLIAGDGPPVLRLIAAIAAPWHVGVVGAFLYALAPHLPVAVADDAPWRQLSAAAMATAMSRGGSPGSGVSAIRATARVFLQALSKWGYALVLRWASKNSMKLGSRLALLGIGAAKQLAAKSWRIVRRRPSRRLTASERFADQLDPRGLPNGLEQGATHTSRKSLLLGMADEQYTAFRRHHHAHGHHSPAAHHHRLINQLHQQNNPRGAAAPPPIIIPVPPNGRRQMHVLRVGGGGGGGDGPFVGLEPNAEHPADANGDAAAIAFALANHPRQHRQLHVFRIQQGAGGRREPGGGGPAAAAMMMAAQAAVTPPGMTDSFIAVLGDYSLRQGLQMGVYRAPPPPALRGIVAGGTVPPTPGAFPPSPVALDGEVLGRRGQNVRFPWARQGLPGQGGRGGAAAVGAMAGGGRGEVGHGGLGGQGRNADAPANGIGNVTVNDEGLAALAGLDGGVEGTAAGMQATGLEGPVADVIAAAAIGLLNVLPLEGQGTERLSGVVIRDDGGEGSAVGDDHVSGVRVLGREVEDSAGVNQGGHGLTESGGVSVSPRVHSRGEVDGVADREVVSDIVPAPRSSDERSESGRSSDESGEAGDRTVPVNSLAYPRNTVGTSGRGNSSSNSEISEGGTSAADIDVGGDGGNRRGLVREGSGVLPLRSIGRSFSDGGFVSSSSSSSGGGGGGGGSGRNGGPSGVKRGGSSGHLGYLGQSTVAATTSASSTGIVPSGDFRACLEAVKGDLERLTVFNPFPIPAEALVLILQQLDAKDLARFSTVSRACRQVAETPALWVRLMLRQGAPKTLLASGATATLRMKAGGGGLGVLGGQGGGGGAGSVVGSGGQSMLSLAGGSEGGRTQHYRYIWVPYVEGIPPQRMPKLLYGRAVRAQRMLKAAGRRQSAASALGSRLRWIKKLLENGVTLFRNLLAFLEVHNMRSAYCHLRQRRHLCDASEFISNQLAFGMHCLLFQGNLTLPSCLWAVPFLLAWPAPLTENLLLPVSVAARLGHAVRTSPGGGGVGIGGPSRSLSAAYSLSSPTAASVVALAAAAATGSIFQPSVSRPPRALSLASSQLARPSSGSSSLQSSSSTTASSVGQGTSSTGSLSMTSSSANLMAVGAVGLAGDAAAVAARAWVHGYTRFNIIEDLALRVVAAPIFFRLTQLLEVRSEE